MTPPMEGFDTAAHLRALATDGFTVIPDFLSAGQLQRVRQGLAPHLGGPSGRNDFEGFDTQRVYTLVARGRLFEDLAEDARLRALLDANLLPGYLLTASQAINIRPGETAQALHVDDGFYRLPRPRPAVSFSMILAVDDFTAENGATDIIPGSHRWGDQKPDSADRQPVVMPAGSCVFFLGTLWHGGGASRSDRPRLAVTAQYCEPWVRPQEAFTLSMTRGTVRAVSEDIRRMLGYSIHPPFIGQVDGMHPMRLLE